MKLRVLVKKTVLLNIFSFLALGKEDGWNVSRLEDSLIETIRYLPPEQACWSHTRLHRILSVANGPDPPPEMNWNEVGFYCCACDC